MSLLDELLHEPHTFVPTAAEAIEMYNRLIRKLLNAKAHGYGTLPGGELPEPRAIHPPQTRVQLEVSSDARALTALQRMHSLPLYGAMLSVLC